MSNSDFPAAVIDDVRRKSASHPSVALVLGSGLGSFAEQIAHPVRIAAKDIPGYPTSTVAGHAGSLVFGSFAAGPDRSPELLVFQGRVHYYESGNVATAVAPIRLAYALGVRTVILTNAAGGIDVTFRPGDLMLIRDVLALNPLRLPSFERPQLLDPRALFDQNLTERLRQISNTLGTRIVEGTYAWVHGPSYETAAEIRMLRTMGAHAVGMSTVPEVYEARRLGMRVLGISLISNMGTGILSAKLSHEEVTGTAREASGRFTSLLVSFLSGLS